MQRFALFALLIASVTTVAEEPAPLDLLSTLSKQLRHARSEPRGTPLIWEGPKTLEPLLGISGSTVRSALGAPDFEGGPIIIPSRVRDRWLYFLRPVDAEDPGVISMGSFPPGLQFLIDAEQKVIDAQCNPGGKS